MYLKVTLCSIAYKTDSRIQMFVILATLSFVSNLQ